MTSERWRDVPEWEGYYSVSSHGRVRSNSRTVETKPGHRSRIQERILKQTVGSDGYLVVTLRKPTLKKQYRVNRLVLLAFRGPCPNGHVSCHNNGDRLNNALSNLRWDTLSANAQDVIRHGKNPLLANSHCPHGHEFNAVNTYIGPGRKARQCRKCRYVNNLRSRLRARVAHTTHPTNGVSR